MNDTEASKVLTSMIQFIRTHGDERVATINNQAQEEFTIQKEKYIAEEKERLIQDYRNKLQQDEIKLRIQKSAEQNAARIQKMKTVRTSRNLKGCTFLKAIKPASSAPETTQNATCTRAPEPTASRNHQQTLNSTKAKHSCATQ